MPLIKVHPNIDLKDVRDILDPCFTIDRFGDNFELNLKNGLIKRCTECGQPHNNFLAICTQCDTNLQKEKRGMY